ncbi:MAG: hypothetical protein L0213_10085 [Candidatus Dadabacteria bacterium]|nr:hypothetical protein [Candidatus Dadabacteria bacterium]
MRYLIFVLLLPITVMFACAKAEYSPPDLGGIYTQAAMRSHVDGNPVIVIPGILGSKLRDGETGQLVWGAFDGGEADPETPEGRAS